MESSTSRRKDPLEIINQEQPLVGGGEEPPQYGSGKNKLPSPSDKKETQHGEAYVHATAHDKTPLANSGKEPPLKSGQEVSPEMNNQETPTTGEASLPDLAGEQEVSLEIFAEESPKIAGGQETLPQIVEQQPQQVEQEAPAAVFELAGQRVIAGGQEPLPQILEQQPQLEEQEGPPAVVELGPLNVAGGQEPLLQILEQQLQLVEQEALPAVVEEMWLLDMAGGQEPPEDDDLEFDAGEMDWDDVANDDEVATADVANDDEAAIADVAAIAVVAPPPPNPLQCTICLPKICIVESMGGLHRHKKSLHKNTCKKHCATCGAKLSSKDGYLYHYCQF